MSLHPAEDVLRVEPTGRKVIHPWTCGNCHGKGCPEVRLVGDIREVFGR